jgi:hypothetical protein
MTAAVLIPLFNSILTVAGTVIAGVLLLVIKKYVTDKNAQDVLATAISNASGVALSVGQANGDQFLQNHAVKNAALGQAINYVADQAAQAKAHFGLTDADIATKITAHVAKDLSLATPIPPSPPAPVVEPVPDPAPAPVTPTPVAPVLTPVVPSLAPKAS